MNKLEYDKRLGELIKDANNIRCQFTEGKYFNYLRAVRQISKLRKVGVVMQDSNSTCHSCKGTGKKKDSTGFYPLNCDQCKGTGVLEILTIPADQNKTRLSPLSI